MTLPRPVRIEVPLTFPKSSIPRIAAAAVRDGLQLDWHGPPATEDEVVEAVMEAARRNSTVDLVRDLAPTHELGLSELLEEERVYHHLQWQDPETGLLRVESRDGHRRKEFDISTFQRDIRSERKSDKPFFMSGGPGWADEDPGPAF